MKKKIVGIFICLLFLFSTLPTIQGADPDKNKGSSATTDISNIKNTVTEKVYYPMVKLEWNISETRLEWINSGLFGGLIKLDEISGNYFSIVFWSKYKVDYGTVNVKPLSKPNFDLVSGDIITWNLVLYKRDMNQDNSRSQYAFGVVIEKSNNC